MDFAYSDKVESLRARLLAFMDEQIVPRLGTWRVETDQGHFPPPFMAALKARARAEGLWNLFLPGLHEDEPGTRLTNLEYAPLAEIMGRVAWASEVFNCNAPDTGNMELLHLFGTPAQRERWLRPLLEGTIRSAFAMTEPAVASSDATNIATRIERQRGEWVINGRKWFITNAAHPDCRILIVMGKTDPTADRHHQQSMVLVPLDTPGVKVVRNLAVMNHHAHEGHCEIDFSDVRVPHDHLLGEIGGGFAMAQARLGPGRIHHCMRSIGAAELALELMVERAGQRHAFGRTLDGHGVVREWIARSRIEIDQARLLVLKAAWIIDRHGARAAQREVAMIKAAVPRVHTAVCDRAMQVFGAMGLSPDTPLADHYTWGRALRLADGPDEVHLQHVAKLEMATVRHGAGRYLVPPLS